MTKKVPTNQGKRWTDSDINKLEKLAKKNTPTGLIARAMCRSEDSVASKANSLDLSLKPVNKSPYNRRLKK